MPNKKSAEKELRKTKKRTIDNKKVSANAKALVKNSLKKVAANDNSAKEDMPKTVKALDKAAKKGVMTKKTASRKKSRLMKKVNKIK
ncbi:MAG: 30S ribosomal protein S20 [Patescibacteria group bacterium]|jgi:small subunit ribosomal protein S20|nr:30S ribosomal protein S20 [Patescibacteria group bacterium]